MSRYWTTVTTEASIPHSQCLDEIGAVASVGPRGESYENALDESTIWLYKAELVRNHGPWRGIDGLELATVTYVDRSTTAAFGAPAATPHS